MVMGDFNLREIKWDPNKDLNLTPQFQAFMDIINNFGLTQLNHNPSTNKGNILDIILTNFPQKCTNIFSSTYSYHTDHYFLDFIMQLHYEKITTAPRTIFNMRRADIPTLKNELIQSQLNTRLEDMDTVDNKWKLWKKALSTTIDKNVPQITIKHSNNPPWMDKPLVQKLR